MAPRLPPIHPGEILKETLDDLGLSMNRLSQEIRVPANRISSIIAGQRSIVWRRRATNGKQDSIGSAAA